jgi:hypothetical protein
MELSKPHNHTAELRMLATLNNISSFNEHWLIKSNEAGFLRMTFASVTGKM